ncbi:hypothetical protein [Bacillus toyonensis]|uniref:hypothetical protein n=1 Tax=Bacillus toyonensis TaxID=155322 RepID=UPI000BF62CF7|nr:hypothetical protein [Bacillus toyonensis]PGF05172.1 hypothetical protein COM61_01755 [Bacillus toyonensis]
MKEKEDSLYVVVSENPHDKFGNTPLLMRLWHESLDLKLFIMPKHAFKSEEQFKKEMVLKLNRVIPDFKEMKEEVTPFGYRYTKYILKDGDGAVWDAETEEQATHILEYNVHKVEVKRGEDRKEVLNIRSNK